MVAAITESARSAAGPDALAPVKLVVERFSARHFRSYVTSVDQQILPTSHDDHVIQEHVWMGSAGVSMGRRPASVSTATIRGDNLIVAFPMGSRRPDRVNGTPLRQPYFWVAAHGAEVDLLQTEPYEFGQIVLPPGPEVLDPFRQNAGLAVWEVGDGALHPVRDLVKRIIGKAAVAPETLSHPRAVTLIHETIALVLAELSDRVHKPNVGRLSFPVAQRLVRQIDAYIGEVGAAGTSPESLARHLGRSLRTVHASLAAVKGMSLGKYLLTARLWNARRTLEAAPPGTLVKTVALDEGFWHFGRFAQRYAELFGKSPSQTLQRSR